MKNLGKNRYIRIAIIVGLILLVPLALTLLNPNAGIYWGEGGGWGVFDFIIMGALLFATGVAIDFLVRKLTNPVHRFFSVIVVVTILFLIWVELAVDGISKLFTFLFR